MLNKLTNREIFSFIFVLYTNIHMFLLFAYENFYGNMLINNLFIYLLIDIIWIYLDKNVKIFKQELITHHIATIILINSDTDMNNKLQVLLIETSTLLLFILKISKGLIKKICYYLFLFCWIFFRVIWLYIWFIKYKVLNIYSQNFQSYARDTFTFMIIYLLGIKWTLDFMKMSKYKSYTSILLGIPIYYSIEYLTNLQFVSIFNLIVASFIHHLIRNKISCSIDEFFITFTCLVYLNYNIYIINLLSLISFLSKYFINNNYNNRFVYIYTLIQYSRHIFLIRVIAIFLTFGFSDLMINNKSSLWHLSNGIYLSIVSKYLYLQ